MNAIDTRFPARFFSEHRPLVFLAIGLLAMYLPTAVGVYHTVWLAGQYDHGPIVLGLAAWLAWSRREAVAKLGELAGNPWLGGVFFAFGLLCYVVGRSQNVIQLDMGSSILVFAGLVLAIGGLPLLRVMWFPIAFLIFAVPFPPSFVDAVTQPMKSAVSVAVEAMLGALGYPVARAGVILQVGQYQLLVADACAGLQTLFTLESLGLFYMNVVRSTSVVRNVLMALLIVPISFTANVVRVALLCLITYYFGDEAGQGFLHGFAGILLFLVALVLLLGIDGLISRVLGLRSARAVAAA